MPNAIAGAIGLLLFNAGVSLAVVNAVTLTIIPALVRIGVGLAISAGISAALRPRTPPIKPSDAQQEIRQEVGPRRRSFGRLRLNGAVWWVATDLNEPDVVFIGLVLNHGRIGQIVQRYLDRNPVEVNGASAVTTEPYFSATDEVFLYSNLGLATETAYLQITNKFGVTNCRGDGLFTVLFEADNRENAERQLEIWPNGLPDITVLADTSVVFDPRQALHDRTDETTWEYSDNPIVCLFHYVFVDPDGYGIDFERVSQNLPEWIAAMNVCDETFALNGGGTEKRYRLAMSYRLTDDPVDVAARILASCDGRMWPRRDGQIGISVGKFIAPTVIIESNDIIGYSDLTRGQSKLSKVAGVRAQYLSPDHDYTEQDVEAYPDGATVAALADDRTINLDLTMVPSDSQARRLMKREFIRQNPNWRGKIITNLSGLRAIDERFVTVVIDELAINETFEVGNFTLDPSSMQVVLDIASLDATVDQWDETTEEGTPPADDPLTLTEIDPTGLTKLGNMTSGGGLAAAFDGDSTENAANSASRGSDNGFVGLTFSTPRTFKKALVHGSNNEGYANPTVVSESTVTLRIYGKTGAAPSSAGDGTVIGTHPNFTDSSNESGERLIGTTDRETSWDHVWLRITTSGFSVSDVYCAELRVFV